MIRVLTVWKRPNAVTQRAHLAWPPSEKRCLECERPLAIDNFHVHTRYPCGVPRLWQAYCKDCMRERTRFFARQRRRRLGIPERAGGPYKISSGYHESGYQDKVPIEPFAHWLQGHVNDIDGRNAYFEGMERISGVSEVASQCLIDTERIRKIVQNRSGQKYITIGFVDRILVGTGTSTQLWELYPESETPAPPQRKTPPRKLTPMPKGEVPDVIGEYRRRRRARKPRAA